MSVGLQRDELLELFDSQTVLDEDMRLIEYKVAVGCHFLIVCVSVLDEFATVKLFHKESKDSLVSIGVDRLSDITVVDGTRLYFFQDNFDSNLTADYLPDPVLILQVKPTISLSCNL